MELLLRRRGVRDGGDELTHHPLLQVTFTGECAFIDITQQWRV